MIYVNNNFIDLFQAKGYTGEDPLLNFIKEKIIEIEDFSKKIVFKYRPNVIRRNKKEGIKEGKKLHVRWMNTITSTRGSETWVCTPSVAKDPVTGYVKPVPKHEMFGESWILDRDADRDKVLFMLCAASCARGANPLVIREDIDAEAALKFNDGLDASKFKIKLSELKGTQLHQLAMACGIGRPKTLSDIVLRTTIFNKSEFDVKKGNKTYAEYLTMAASSENSKLLALIQEGIDRLVISYSERRKGFWWLMANEQLDEELIPVSPGHYEQKEALLAEFLKQNNAQYVKLTTTLKAVKAGDDVLKKASEEPIATAVPENPEIPEVSEETVSVDVLGEAIMGETKSVIEPEVFKTPDEGEMTLAQIEVYAVENEALPFATNDVVMNIIAKYLKIPLATPKRKRSVVYDELKVYFGLKA